MAEYIDKWQAVSNLIFAGLKDDQKAVDAIQYMPAADVQPVRRGKWIIVDQGDTACLVECDQCGMHYIVGNDVFDEWLAAENRNYCPKCGAYMREKNEICEDKE